MSLSPQVCKKNYKVHIPDMGEECEFWLVTVTDEQSITNPDKDHAYLTDDKSLYVYNGKELVLVGFEHIYTTEGDLDQFLPNYDDCDCKGDGCEDYVEKLAIKETATGNPTIISDSADWRLQKLNVYGQSEQDGTPSVENPIPIISKEVSEIKVTGANLFDFVTLAGGEGATFERNGLSARIENGYLITTGTAINDAYTNIIMFFVPPEKRPIFPAGTYRLGRGDKGMGNLTIGVTTVSGKGPVNYNSAFTTDEPFYINYFYITYALGQNANGEKCPLIMAYGSEPLYEYEPYIEPQVINLTSPITLRGIRFSGGSVTIDGKQYFSDVIKEKDGVIGVERYVAKLVFDGSDDEIWSVNSTDLTTCIRGEIYPPRNTTYPDLLIPTGMFDKLKFLAAYRDDSEHGYCQSGIFIFIDKSRLSSLDADGLKAFLKSNSITTIFKVENPTFEPLPEDIQAQYKALKSYYPNTVIQTGCWNEVEYVADTKMYIDKKLSEISSQLTELKADTLLLGGM